MAAGDALPIPRKNVAYRVTFPILDADGDLVAGAAGLDSEISKDGGTFVNCTNEATQIATSSGMYFLDLTATEMNADTVAIIVKTSTAGAKTTPIVLYPEEAGDIRVNVTSWRGTTPAGLVSTLVPANVSRWRGDVPNDLISARVDASVGAMASAVLTATAIATNAITAAKIAANAVGSSEFAQAAADKVWSTAARILTANTNFNDPTAAAVADQVWDEARADHGVAGSFGERVLADVQRWLGVAPNALLSGRVETEIGRFGDLEIRRNTCQAGSTASTLKLDAGASSTDLFYVPTLVILVGGTGAGKVRFINSYIAALVLASISPDWKTTPDATTDFVILGLGLAGLEMWRGAVPSTLAGGKVKTQVEGMDNAVVSNSAIAALALSAGKIASAAFTADKFASDTDTYQAKVWIIDDDSGSTDRYVFAFFKNGKQITSGVTVPTMWAYSAAASPADLVGTSGAPQALTEAGSEETWFHDETTNRIVGGTAYFARVRFTVDGSEREWTQPIGRDS